MIAEVALSVVLLLGAGVLMRSFMSLVQADLGFNTSNLVLANVRFPSGAYASPSERQTYYKEAVQRVGSLPGVVAAAASSMSPLAGMPTTLEVPGDPRVPPGEARFTLSDEDYLRVLQTHAVRGRTLSGADVTAGRTVAVVNETLVRRFLGDQEAIGKSIRLAALSTLPERSPIPRSRSSVSYRTSRTAAQTRCSCISRRPACRCTAPPAVRCREAARGRERLASEHEIASPDT